MALKGHLGETSFADLIQFYNISRQTVLVTIVSPHGRENDGAFYIEAGEVVHARFAELEGIEAIRRALRLKDGEFHVEPQVTTPKRTVFEQWSKLVLEELVAGDEALSTEVGMMPGELEPDAQEGIAVESLSLKVCPVCQRQFTRGTSCPDDGAPLVEEGKLATATPPRRPAQTSGAPPAQASGPQASAPQASAPQASAPQATPGQGGRPVPMTPSGRTATGQHATVPPRAVPPSRPSQPRGASGSTPLAVPAVQPPILSARADPSGPNRSIPSEPNRAIVEPNRSIPAEPEPAPRAEPRAPLPHTLPPPPAPERKVGIIALWVVALVAVVILAVLVLKQRAPAPVAQPERAPVAQVAPEPAQPAVPGVTDTEITFGMSAPFSGPAKELGREMKTGIDIAFAAANEAGGLHGRKLKLIALDDGYEPERTRAVMRELAEQRHVFGFIGNVGTPPAEVSVPFVLERKLLFFGPLTGAGLLRRDPPDRYVFNFRASYAEETAAVVRYLVDVRHIRPQDIAVLAQEDGYGEAGFSGVSKVMRLRYQRDPTQILRVGYKRNTSEVGDAVAAVLKARPRAVVMVPTYKAAAKFIEKVKAERPDTIFTSVSFVGSTALADELIGIGGTKLAEGVIVTQVVPLPTSKSTAVLRYQEFLPRYSVGEKPDFISLEGYLSATLLLEAIKRAGPKLSTEQLVTTLESMKGMDLGIGAELGFGMSEHQASHRVWGTVIDSQGAYQTLDLE